MEARDERPLSSSDERLADSARIHSGREENSTEDVLWFAGSIRFCLRALFTMFIVAVGEEVDVGAASPALKCVQRMCIIVFGDCHLQNTMLKAVVRGVLAYRASPKNVKSIAIPNKKEPPLRRARER